MNAVKIAPKVHTARVEHVWRTAIAPATARRIAAKGAEALQAATVALWEAQDFTGQGVTDAHSVIWTRNASPASALSRVSWSVLATALRAA